MSEALRAQERLHNAIAKLDRLLEKGAESINADALTKNLSEEMDDLRKENTRLKDDREKVKLRLDTLIASIEKEGK